jgi:DedD protein
MRTLFDIEEEEQEESRASEITLGTASLLGIFFGLVLICGVFFGFGYSLGRGTAWVSQAKSTENKTVARQDAAAVTAPPEGANPAAAAEPETSARPAVPETKVRPAAAADTASDRATKQETAADDAVADEAPARVAVPLNRKPAPGREAPAYQPTPQVAAPQQVAASQPVANPYAGKPVVQIAAVSRPQDAYALISALRQRGYSATMRSDAQDKLVHVQVGPFASRDEASAMKAKLLADGYNAIIKQ